MHWLTTLVTLNTLAGLLGHFRPCEEEEYRRLKIRACLKNSRCLIVHLGKTLFPEHKEIIVDIWHIKRDCKKWPEQAKYKQNLHSEIYLHAHCMKKVINPGAHFIMLLDFSRCARKCLIELECLSLQGLGHLVWLWLNWNNILLCKLQYTYFFIRN